MRIRYPADQTHLPISLSVYNQLQWASCTTGYKKEDWEIATEAIDEWVRRHDPNALPGPAHAGYQWKRLFLPDGTVLRTVFGGKNHHCLVDGDHIIYEKRAVSPSGFANAVGGIRRNAWKSIWILFPDSKDWKLADSLRNRERPGRARRAPSTVQPEPPPANAHAPLDALPVAADGAVIQPSAGRQSRVARSALRGRLTLAAFKARHTRHAGQDPMDLTRDDVHHEPHPGLEKMPSPSDFTYGIDRRIKGDDRLAALLRQELIPLLCRMAAIDGQQSAGVASAWSRIGAGVPKVGSVPDPAQ
jgi:hypothetical protein